MRPIALIVSAVVLAWVASLDGQGSAVASIAIDATKVENRISPSLYGQFAEFMFENIKFGMHAELLRNRGFEEAPNAIGLSRYWEREPDDRNDDPALRFHWDATVSYPPDGGPEPAPDDRRPGHSLRMELKAADGQVRGIHQGRIPVREGVPYHGYVWIRTEKFEGTVLAALEQDRTGGERYASAPAAPGAKDGDWTQHRFTLVPTASDPLAKLTLLVDGRGRIWLDQVSLVPGDAVDGVRADVFARVKALRSAFIRWPGGNVAQDYHWQWGVGPRDRRLTWTNLSWWNEPEPSDFGTHELIQFSRNLGAAPHLVVNVEGRGATTADAAAWVEYVNGASTTKYGAMRAANGHAEPFGVKTWEIGNEIWGDWVRGHSDARTYATNYRRYHAAMKAVDPTIRFIAVGDNDLGWNRTVLEMAGQDIDHLAIHHYYGASEMAGDGRNLMARPLFYERFYAQMARLFRELVPKRRITLVINEWNTSLPVPRQHSMESALYGARLMNVFERSGDLIEMTAVSDLVNGWPGGIIQASRHDVFVTPTYLVIRLYNERLGSERLGARVTSPTFDSSKEGTGIPVLDVAASRSADGRQLFVKAVNTSPDSALKTTIEVSGAVLGGAGTMQTVTADTLAAANSFRTPDAVTERTTPVQSGQRFTVDIPPHSVAVLTLPISRR